MWLGLNALGQLLETSTHPRPPATKAWVVPQDPPTSLAGRHLPSLSISPAPHTKPLGRRFEEVLAAMQANGHIYSEGDGSFVWCGRVVASSENRWTLWLGQQPRPVQLGLTADWTDQDPGRPLIWRIEGNLVDGDSRLDHVHVLGAAPLFQWRQFFSMVYGPDPSNLPAGFPTLQLHQFGIYLDLRALLAWEDHHT